MMDKDKQSIKEAIDFLTQGLWIDRMSETESLLLADFLKNSTAKQRKQVVMVGEVKDGFLYAVYKIKHKRNDSVMSIVTPGTIYVKGYTEPIPTEVENVPRLAFSTLFCLGDIVASREN
jgi:hypothetical protein